MNAIVFDTSVLDPADCNAIHLAVGNILRRERKRRGWNVSEYASYVGIGSSTLSRIELGRRFPAWEVLIVLCCGLGIRPSDLLRQAENDAFPCDKPWARTSKKGTP